VPSRARRPYFPMADHKFKGCDPSILRQLLVESGLQYTQNGKSYVFTCPRCKGKKKLFMRKADGRFVCWKCKETDGYQGRPEFALADLLDQTIKQVAGRLYGGAYTPTGVFLDVRVTDFFDDGDEDDDVEEEIVSLPTVLWPFDYYELDHPFAAKGVRYLANRGVPVDIAMQYGIRYWPEGQRVIFPVQDAGSLYGWQGRLIIPHQYVDPETGEDREALKIQSSKAIPRERVLMFADRLQGVDHAVLGEGPVDAIKAHLCGGNVSPMGKAVGPEQMGLLLNHGIKRFYSGLDPDAADEFMRLVRTYYDDVEIYQLAVQVKGAKEKPDLGAMDFKDVYDLFVGAERVRAGQVFVFLDPRVIGRQA
jgi:hypothetical protein